MRKLSYKPLISGLIAGLNRGMNSSNEVFDIDLIIVQTDRFDGLRHDRDTLRGDVQRAKTKFDSFVKINKGSIAAS